MEDRSQMHRHQPRSRSEDFEDDRYGRHQRLERDNRRTGSHKRYHDDVQEHRSSEHRSSAQRDSHRDDHRKRRRSLSPAMHSPPPRHRERSPKHRVSHRRSPEPRRSGERSSKSLAVGIQKGFTGIKSGPLPSQAESFSIAKDPSAALVRMGEQPLQEKQKPNFAPTGLLAAASNTIAHADGTSIVLKYHEPPEARKPPSKDQWKLFVFKGSDILETIELSLRSCWLVGRELAVVDLAAEHPSVSKQHAVIQFRWIEKKNEFGDKLGKVKPYLIDLESANGTKLNKEVVPNSRYLELRDKDMIQFGDSTREYVLMLPPKE